MFALGAHACHAGKVLVVIGINRDGRVVGIYLRDRECHNYVMQVIDPAELSEAPPVEPRDPAEVEQERKAVRARMAAVREILRKVREAR